MIGREEHGEAYEVHIVAIEQRSSSPKPPVI